MSSGGTAGGTQQGPPTGEGLAVRPLAWVFALLLGAGAVLLSSFYTDRNLPFQDEGATLTAAARILRGEVFYRDIDAYPFPGAAYLAAGAMAVFGEHLAVARALAAALFCSWVLALYFVALRCLGLPRAALFGSALLAWKFLAWPAFSTYMYSDLAFAAGCGVLACLFASRRQPGPFRVILAGLLAAIAVAGKQNLGLYLGAATLAVLMPSRLPWRLPGVTSWGPFWFFGFSAGLPLLGAALWFGSHGVLGQLLYSGLLRPMTGYLPTSGIDFSPMLAWWNLGSLRGPDAASYFVLDYFQLLMVGALPWPRWEGALWLSGEIFSRGVYTAVTVSVVWWVIRIVKTIRRKDSQAGRDAPPPVEASFGLISLAMLASAFPRADFFHIISVAPPVLLLLILLFARVGAPMRWPRATTAGVLLLLSVCASLAWVQRSLLTEHVVLQRADVWVAPENAWMESLVKTIRDQVPEGAPFYVYGHEAQLYFLTGRFFSWPFSQLYPGQEGEDGGQEIIDRLVKDPPTRIVRGRQFWPGMPRAAEYAPRLDRWVRHHYAPDRDPFRLYPLPEGLSPPQPQWMTLLVWRGSPTQGQ
ncbi:MAG: glycosyltransferase family 39 protein [Myxococcota bacterium]|nr:glycosyltransferase family 39 protein [Myxococcota bacterium]